MTIRDWDKTGDAFSIAKGTVCSGCYGNGDFFIADRGDNSVIHAFESPGVYDTAYANFDYVVPGPGGVYQDTAYPEIGRTYVIRSQGRYAKVTITEIGSDPSGVTVYTGKSVSYTHLRRRRC